MSQGHWLLLATNPNPLLLNKRLHLYMPSPGSWLLGLGFPPEFQSISIFFHFHPLSTEVAAQNLSDRPLNKYGPEGCNFFFPQVISLNSAFLKVLSVWAADNLRLNLSGSWGTYCPKPPSPPGDTLEPDGK